MSDDEKPKLTIVSPIKEKNKRISISKKLRHEVFKRDNFKCFYCGVKPSDGDDVILEVDHVLPVCEGGTNDIDNLVTSCKDCNRGKGKTKLNDKNYSSLKKAEHDAVDDKIDVMKEFVKSRMNKSREIEPACDYIHDTMNKWKHMREDNDERVVSDEYKNKLLVLYKKTSMEDLIDATEQCEVVFLGKTVECDYGYMPYNRISLPSNYITGFYLQCITMYLDNIIDKKKEEKKSDKRSLDTPNNCSAYLVAVIKNRTQGYDKWEVSTDVRRLVSTIDTKQNKVKVLNEILIPMSTEVEQDSDYTEFYNEMFNAIEMWKEIRKETNES
jgi:hypothetical protein